MNRTKSSSDENSIRRLTGADSRHTSCAPTRNGQTGSEQLSGRFLSPPTTCLDKHRYFA